MTLEESATHLGEILKSSRHTVFFGGAGVSVESGIPDFRSVDGLYNTKWKYPPETVLSHSFFESHTEDFYEFYREKMIALWAKPNPAHKRLAEWERAGKSISIVTQNIDGLHQAAGSQVVYELHGSVHRNRCMECGKLYDVHAVADCEGIPHCICGGIIKPEVVLYEEPLDDQTVTGAVNAIASADTMIIAGTSLRVYPAAGLIRYFGGEHLICIDPAAKEMRGAVTLTHPVGKLFEKIHLS
ncbi:MAG: NAD-dependent protein deacylase [Clostridia bacterium]|nr:NAD-dependent protein deacylase [Clostridia bacterium]